MKAILRSHGVPAIATIFNNAVAAAKVLVDLMADEDFAELSTITLDFEGDGFTPVMNVDQATGEIAGKVVRSLRKVPCSRRRARFGSLPS